METEKEITETKLEIVKDFFQKIANLPLEKVEFLVSDKKKQNNIKTKQIPLKVLMPLLEGVLLEDDDELKYKWSGLLINSILPYAKQDTGNFINNTIYPSILSQLSSNEARCVDRMIDNTTYGNINFYDLRAELELNLDNINNLKRLGLLEVKKGLTISKPEHDDEEGDSEYKLTSLGGNFIKACQLNKKSEVI